MLAKIEFTAVFKYLTIFVDSIFIYKKLLNWFKALDRLTLKAKSRCRVVKSMSVTQPQKLRHAFTNFHLFCESYAFLMHF